MINQHNSLIGFLVYDADLHFDRFRHLDTVEAADRLIEGIDQADLDTFVAVLAKLKENADNYSNNG